MTITIRVNNQAITDALAQLQGRVGDISPVLAALGEDVMERTKQRFASATAPDGARWQSNAQSTLMHYLQEKGGFSAKTGKLSAKGQKLAINKRPLQGDSGRLASQFKYDVTSDALTVGSTMIYAAMQQYGGTKGQFPNLWGNIPARPFLPVTPGGELYPGEVDKIVAGIRQYLLE